MQLQDYIRILLKRGWMIVLVALIAGVSAIVFSKLQRPVYKSSVKLSVNPARPSDYGQTLGIKNILWNFSTQMNTRRMAQQVSDRLQLDLPADKLLSKVRFDPDEATYTIQVEARDHDPVLAKDIAQTWAQVFVEKRTADNLELDQRDRILVTILDDAQYGSKFSPRTKINALAGAVLGALLGTVIVFGLEYLEAGTIRTAEDVERHVDLPVLGAIPSAAAPGARAQQRRWWQVWQKA